MKKALLIFLVVTMFSGQCFAINDWIRGDGSDAVKGTDDPSDIDANVTNYLQDPLDKVLTNYVHGCTLTHTSDDVITVSIGEVVCSNGAGSIKRFRKNTSTTTVDFTASGVGGIDSGSARDDSSWFAIYAVADADATTFTAIAAKQGTALSDVTYYRYLGSVYNDGSDNISNFTWIGNGSEITVLWDVPVNVTTTISDGAWSAGSTSCSTGMPNTSTLGIFGLYVQDNGSSVMGIWIRPDGTTWATDQSNGIYLLVTSQPDGIGGQRICATSSAQAIDYYNHSGDDVTRIDVEGFILNR